MSPRFSTRLLARQPDARLLALLGEGNERAFEAIVRRYRAELLAYCRRLGLSDARAEDAVQHALLKAWLALQGGTEVRELRAWLYRVTHNTAVNVMRNSPEQRVVDLDDALIDAAAAPDFELERSTAAREALAGVAALPPMQRHAILLSAVEGRSHREVASALGISDVAVRGLIYRARVTLRAAAAAVTPAPLIGWVSQTAGRLSLRAGEGAQLASGGGADAGSTLLKGAAVLAAGALAAGAVLGPLRSHHAPARGAIAEGATRAAHGGDSAASATSPASPGSAGASGSSAAAHGTIAPASLRVAPVLAGVHAPASNTTRTAPSTAGRTPVASTHPTTAAGQGAAPAPGAGQASAGVATVSSTVSSGAPGGSSGGGTTTSGGGTTTSGGGTTEPPAGGSGGAPPPGEHEAGDGAAEREAQAAKEKAEREAEAAREQREREAELAREPVDH